MNTVAFYSLWALVAYLIILFIITYQNSQRESVEDFSIGSRNIGLIGTIATIVAGFRDGAGLAVWVSLAYFFGFGALWLTTGLGAGLLLLGIAAPFIYKTATSGKYITVGDWLKNQVGINTARTASVVIACTAFLYAAAQIFVSGNIFAQLFGLQENVGIWLTAAIVASYLIVGGYKTVVRTDVLQWAIIMVILVLPFFLGNPQLDNSFFTSFMSPGIESIIGFFGLSFLVAYSSADIWQRIFSAQSGSVAKKAFHISIPIYFLISIGLILFGLAAKSVLGDIGAQDAFFAIFSLSSVPPLIIAVLGLFAAASVMSTLDTQVFLFASTITNDLLPSKYTSDKKFVASSRVTTALLLFLLAFLATSVVDLISFFFGAVTLGTILAPVLFLSTYFKQVGNQKRDTLISVALIIAALVYAVMFYRGDFNNVLLTLIPAGVSLILSSTIFIFSNSRS